MPDPPGVTVTFLFTDIEGSTRLWEHSPAEMGPALARHDVLLRAAIEGNEGTVFKTVGDAFCAAFPTAAHALTAAHAAQLALAQEPWPEPARIRVRMALHTGVVEVRDNEYFGRPLNRVARLLAAGHGGQVLLSLATQELVRDILPVGIILRDMGDRRLKDLIRPERVYQLVAPDLRTDFPPLKTLDGRAHNLPIQLTSFVGREREMQEVKTLLRSSRLVTLTGSGGAGKTRLSLQIGADLIDDFADGAWLVQLAPLTDERLVPQAVATVLGLKEEPGVALTETLTQALKNKELLLILDNCEHLVEASASLCQALLSSCAGARILASSREALRVAGEAPYRVPSLATPDPKAPISVASLTLYAAVRLFIDRALAVKPSFQVDYTNAPAVASICHRLDGIPLAIELAAARVRSMSADEVNRRLDQRFRLLTGGSRTALPRQQTLRSLIDWSYDLLDETEQALLRRLAFFAGGWTLDAAEEVCSGEGIDEGAELDLLTSLSDKNLVLTEERNGVTRYRLLESVRQYARDRLLERGDEARWQARHLAYFVAMAEEAEPQLTGADQGVWLDRLETEHDNLRAALAWSSVEGGDAAGGLRLAGALRRFWYVRGYLGEGRARLSELLAATSDMKVTASRANALSGAGVMAAQQGDYPAARVLYDESLAIRRQLGDRVGTATSLGNLANLAAAQGDYSSARALHEESLAIRSVLGDRSGIAMSLTNLGLIALEQADYPAARAWCEESLAMRRELGDRWGIAVSLNNLGLVALDQGDYPIARALHEESLAIRQELGDRVGIALSLNNLGDVSLHQGDWASARAVCEQSLAIFREVGERWGIGESLNNLGLAALDQGDSAAARTLHEESLAIRRELGDQRGVAESLEGLACVAFNLADPGRAVRIWAGAERLRETIGSPLPPSDRPHYQCQVAAARAAFGDTTVFDLGWQEGRAMTLEQAIKYALGDLIRHS
ncbi:MAG: tetratricopeptide repeat protein [Betaproteobacteria bacterium]